MGGFQAIQPLVSKEGIRPTLMVRSAAATPSALPFPEDAPQPPPYPAVHRRERRLVAVLEVFKPAPKRRIQRRDDRPKALAGRALRLAADRRFELLQALGSREALAPIEPI